MKRFKSRQMNSEEKANFFSRIKTMDEYLIIGKSTLETKEKIRITNRDCADSDLSKDALRK